MSIIALFVDNIVMAQSATSPVEVKSFAADAISSLFVGRGDRSLLREIDRNLLLKLLIDLGYDWNIISGFTIDGLVDELLSHYDPYLVTIKAMYKESEARTIAIYMFDVMRSYNKAVSNIYKDTKILHEAKTMINTIIIASKLNKECRLCQCIFSTGFMYYLRME